MHECIVRMEMPEACVWRDDKGHIKMCPMYWEDEARCKGKDGKKLLGMMVNARTGAPLSAGSRKGMGGWVIWTDLQIWSMA